MISIIIRTKDEERWISEVLRSIYRQDEQDIEVIIVDNNSTDRTVDKAKKFDVRVVNINEYLPGKALNEGIRQSRGEYIVCLSAHCVPVNNTWLSHLRKDFDDETVAGVYGRQEPLSFSSNFDKRDLLTIFGLDRRVQKKDAFFHNANSMIRRDLWEKIPFDETVTNIEDRVWAQKVIDAGYILVYEPEARVYHHHGIHQNANEQRCSGVVNVLEKIESLDLCKDERIKKINECNICAFIPVKGEMHLLGGRPLVEYTIRHALSSKYIKKTYVLTDNPEIKKTAITLGASVPFLRKAQNEESLDELLKHSLEKIEAGGDIPDIVAIMWETFPFREEGYVDKLIYELVVEGFDSVISAKPLFETCWQEGGKDGYVRLDSGNIPREKRKKMYIGIEGLGYVTYPDCIRRQNIYNTNIGLVEVHNPTCAIKVRNVADISFAEQIIDTWF